MKRKIEKQNPETTIQPFRHENHARPITRRDLLGQGYLGMQGMILAPSVLSMLASTEAFGLECAASSGAADANRQAAFLVFDLAGGANIPGSNVMVGKRGGQLDFMASYRTLGLPEGMHPRNSGQVNSELGLAFHADSGFLRGIKSTAQASTLANVDGAVFCAASNDDTGNNPHNPMYWINKAGAKGELTGLIGTVNSTSGGRAVAPAASINPAAQPVAITRPADALRLVNPGKLANLLSTADVRRIMGAARSMSAAQMAMFQDKDLPAQVKELIECGYIQSSELLTKYDANALDPARDTQVSAIYTMANAEQARAATVTKLLLDGYAGTGTIQRGGYDYHDGTRATGEVRDFEAGALIGRALQLAAVKQQDLVVYVFTDGGVASNGNIDNSANGRGKGVWTSDSGQRSAAFMLVYKRDGRPGIRNNNRQIGAFTEAGGVDAALTKVSGSVDTLSKAVVANYLALYGLEGKLAEVVGDNPFGSDLDKYLAFTKLR